MEINSVYELADGRRLANGNTSYIPEEGNPVHEAVELWIAEGGVVLPYSESPQYLETLRGEVIQSIKDKEILLISERIPALDNRKMIDLMVVLWDQLVSPLLDPDLAYARDVFLFAANRVSMATVADKATLEGYDVETDNWPI